MSCAQMAHISIKELVMLMCIQRHIQVCHHCTIVLKAL